MYSVSNFSPWSEKKIQNRCKNERVVTIFSQIAFWTFYFCRLKILLGLIKSKVNIMQFYVNSFFVFFNVYSFYVNSSMWVIQYPRIPWFLSCEGRKTNHNNISPEPHSYHFLVWSTSKSSYFKCYFLKVQPLRKYLFRIRQRYLYQREGREFRGGSDEKMRRMWFGREIVAVCLPPLTPHHAVCLSW